MKQSLCSLKRLSNLLLGVMRNLPYRHKDYYITIMERKRIENLFQKLEIIDTTCIKKY